MRPLGILNAHIACVHHSLAVANLTSAARCILALTLSDLLTERYFLSVNRSQYEDEKRLDV